MPLTEQQDKLWRQRPAPPAGFSESVGLTPFQAHLVYNRGIRSRDQLEHYLAADERLSHDPMLLPDMGRAVARLRRAVEDGELVAVFGDFDTDGVTATALLVLALRELGTRTVPYIPSRVDEGHGLNPSAIRELREQGASLMVTVDCGVGSEQEVALASTIGMDTIITDHHTISGPLPEAAAIVDPSRPDSEYPYSGLTGAGLSFKLVQALYAALGRPSPEHLLELAALGTVADVAPLTGENRYLVKLGLERLNRTEQPGLKALIARAGLTPGSIDTEGLSFRIIPRLNAAGRLADATLSLEVLIAASPQEASPKAAELQRLNDERRTLSKEAIEQAQAQLGPRSENTPPVLVVESAEWLPGILGLVAASLVDRYQRPAVAVAVEDGVCRASARSVPGFDIVRALAKSSELFLRFGGHPRAAGFTMSADNLPRLKAELQASAVGASTADEVPALDIDCEISPALLDDLNFGFIKSLRPFGEGNPNPVFLTRRARVLDARKVGKPPDHLKMRVGHGGRVWNAIAFKQGDHPVVPGERIDLVYRAVVNDWGAVPSLELEVVDFRQAL